MKDGEYVINLDEYESIGTYWITLYAENVTHFDSFGVEHIPKEIRKFIENKNIATNIYRIPAYDAISLLTHLCRFTIDPTSNFHVEKLSRFHRF